MAKIIVLGAGVMGSAFAQLLADAGNEVYLVGTHLDQEIIDNVLADGTHPKLKVRLPKNVRALSYKQLEGIADERVRLIVFGVNSAGVDWAVARIGPLLKTPVPIVMLTKGLAVRKHSIIILPQAVEEGLSQYGLSGIPVAAVGGPCIAGELAARRQSSVVMACPDTDLLDWLLNLVAAPYYHVRGSTDLIGVEVCAALKNFYTLAVGYAAGQLEQKGRAPNGALMHNLAAGLFTQALAEIQYFVDLLGGQSDSVLGLAGAGDLYVTCQAGRNGRMGKLLGVGMLYRDAKSNHMADDTVEGAGQTFNCGSILVHSKNAMEGTMKRIFTIIFSILALMLIQGSGVASVREIPKDMTEASTKCIDCHKKKTPSIVQQWGVSKHHGANVGCYECHQADEGDPDAFMHQKQLISIIVSPKDCANCHESAVNEMTESHHAKAARILGSLDNLLAEVVEGNSAFITPGFPEGNSAAAVMGCWQCHGSQVKVLDDGSLDPATWPNTGIGRINPDGTEGACSACHSRHAFSVEQARQPENCGKCHMGPDHPQIEIYEESKHGIAYHANKEKMNMDSSKWIVGEDYDAAPTCATCHMSATRKQPVTHDVGARISWNNRPAVSIRPEVSDAKMGLASASINWETRRDNMKDVCSACHSKSYTEAFYIQYDGLIELYNGKYALPGLELMAAAKPLLKPAKFSNKIDWIWFELWHHEGRRARHAASMQGPDYTHWHGTYDLAKHFYTKMVPELEHLIDEGMHHGKEEAAKNLQVKLDEVLNSDDHKWYLDKLDPAEKAKRAKAAAEFKARYD